MNSWDKGLNILPSSASRWATVLNRCRKRGNTKFADFEGRKADYINMNDPVAEWIKGVAKRLEVRFD